MDMQLQQILELVTQPAFLVRDGAVCWGNSAARRLIPEGTPLFSLMEDGCALFSLWKREGTLHLPLILGGAEYDAAVQPTEAGDLFVATLRSRELDAAANAAVNVSASMRKPLHAMITAAGTLFDQLEDKALPSEPASQLNRSFYQLIRLCGQLSDGGQLLLHRRTTQRVPTKLTQFFDRFVQETRPLIEAAGWSLRYEPPAEYLCADIDAGLLERALYNLLANALTYTPRGGAVALRTQPQDGLLLISVADSGEGIAPEVMPNLLDRFSDYAPGDSRRGVGLGLSMVREIARLHGGSLMAGRSAEGGTCVTFSISLEPVAIPLRSNAVQYDYCGELHHGLVELSSVLNASIYDPTEIGA